MKNIRAAFVGFGEVNTPREFIEPRCAAAADELRRRGVELIVAGPVSDDPAGVQAVRAADELDRRQGEFDAVVVCVAGWIPSWAVVKTIERFRHKPILLWGLSGWRDGNRFVTTADQAGTTALRATLAEAGFNFKYLVNFRDAEPRYDEAATYLRAASAAARLRGAFVGQCGFRDMRLYGTAYDPCALKRALGVEVEHFDLLEIAQGMEKVPAAEVERLAKELPARWDFVRAPKPGTVENSVRLALAFKAKIAERGYDAFSFCDVDGVKKLLNFAPAGAMTLLHDEQDIISAPENDTLGCVTGLILKYLSGQPTAYLEFYEFTRRSALMGVPDYVPASVVEGKVTVMPNAFGSFGEGLLNVSKLKTGRVTLARLAWSGGAPSLHIALARAQAPEAWEEAGWAPPAPQLPSLEMVLGDAEGASDDFLSKVQSQHYFFAAGDHRAALRDFAAITGVAYIE